MKTPADRPQLALLAAFVALIIVLPSRAAAQEPSSIVGVVLDETTLVPVAEATVTVEEIRRTARTDANGNFVFQGVPSGRLTIRGSSSGFTTAVDQIDVIAGEVGYVQVFLLPVATVLNEVLVIARGGASGSVVENDLDDNFGAMTAGDLIAREIPGLMMGRSGGVGGGTRLIIRGVKSFTGDNMPAIYLDGVRINHNATTMPFNEAPRLPMLDELPASHVKRIRVLKGPSAAAEFGGDSANGIILIETYRGALE